MQESQGESNKISMNFPLLVRGDDIFMHRNLIKILNTGSYQSTDSCKLAVVC